MPTVSRCGGDAQIVQIFERRIGRVHHLDHSQRRHGVRRQAVTPITLWLTQGVGRPR